MNRRTLLAACGALLIVGVFSVSSAQAQNAYGRTWSRTYNTQDWQRFYHYPYVYYPQNFWGPDYYKSSDDLYYRYPQEMRIPVYNKQWHNEYPQARRYHTGHHFILDTY